MKSVKVITKYATHQGLTISRDIIIGIYAPDKTIEAIDKIKKEMLEGNYKITKDYKDCCNYSLKFENDCGTIVNFSTTDYILNKLNL